MKMIVMLVVLGLGLATVGYRVLADDASPPTTAPAEPINKFCPIMSKNPVKAGVTIGYEGKTIGFCCKKCIATFEKEPEKYLKDMK